MNIEIYILINALESDDWVVNHICSWYQIVLLTPTSRLRRVWNSEYGTGIERAWHQAYNMSRKPKQSPVLVTDSHHPLHPQYGPLLPLAS